MSRELSKKFQKPMSVSKPLFDVKNPQNVRVGGVPLRGVGALRAGYALRRPLETHIRFSRGFG